MLTENLPQFRSQFLPKLPPNNSSEISRIWLKEKGVNLQTNIKKDFSLIVDTEQIDMFFN